MKTRRIIKITKAQLREADGDAFHYIDTTDDTHPYNGQSTITAQGKLNGDENAEPIMTDRIAKQRTPQSWARYRMYGNINRPASTEPKVRNYNIYNEGVEIDTDEQGDEDKDGIDDMYTNVASMGQGNGVKTMSDGNAKNNLAVIPYGVDRRLYGLINQIKQSNLSPKQIATVLDKFQESFPELSQNSGFVKSLLRQQLDPNDIRDFN